MILQQVGNLRCVARDNKATPLPGKFSTLPARRKKKRPELPLDVRRRSEEIGVTTEDLVEIPKAKKKALERSASDASARKVKNPLTKLFSPKLERKGKPVTRSVSDAGSSTSNRTQRKRSGSESEAGSHLSANRAKKQLSPIIEASPQVDAPQPFNFAKTSEAKKSKKETAEENAAKKETTVPGITVTKPPRSPKRSNTGGKSKSTKKESEGPNQDAAKGTKEQTDEVDSTMLHSSRYEQQLGEESTIHKMIHRLSNDRSPPPQLTRSMVSPSPGFGHNNNRPFSYTRPNESSPTPPQGGVIYAQVQMDKKKAQRSHSDSDEGLGLERKDSSRENSPAEKEYRRTDYAYNNDLRRNNEINSFKSRYDEEKRNATTHFGEFNNSREYSSRTTETKRGHEFDDIDRNLFGKPDKYTSTIFVDTSDRGRADGMDARNGRKDNGEFNVRPQLDRGISNKTSELSARRDLLESRIKSRLLADEMFAAKGNTSVPKKMEHEIIDKPIVPSPVTPNRVASPKRYVDTYITETRTNSNGDKYIFEKELHQDNGKVYGYEKKITNKIPGEVYIEQKPRDGYSVETRTDKYGDKYIVETRTHESYADDFKPFLSDRSRTSPEERFQTARTLGSPYKPPGYVVDDPIGRRSEFKENVSPILAPKKFGEQKFSKSEDFLDREVRPIRETYTAKPKKSFENMRGFSKSTQRLDQVGENARVRALRSEYTTRSHENLSTADYVNARDLRRPVFESPTLQSRKIPMSPIDHLRERPNDDYDTDISQLTNSQLGSKYYKETRTTQRYNSKHPLQDEYDSSPPRMRPDRGYNSSRYDSDTTARDSIRRETRYLHQEESSRTLRKDRKTDDEAKKVVRRSRNHLDYFDDSDARDSLRRGVKVGKGRPGGSGLETFDESPPPSPRTFHESKTRHTRHHEVRGHSERRHRESRLSDPDRKDRLADSGIENDYRRDSQEADRREPLESDDEGFVTMRFIKHERRHTDRNMDLTPSEKRRYDKYVNGGTKSVLSKPPSGLGDAKKYEKKVVKKSSKSGTMSKVKQLFSKKEKKAKEESQKSSKKNNRSNSSGALTDDEVTMRYKEYRGDQLRSAKSARDLDSDINQVRDDKINLYIPPVIASCEIISITYREHGDPLRRGFRLSAFNRAAPETGFNLAY